MDAVAPDVRIRFGNRLRQLRQSRGWTQADMADVLGLDRSYLAEIEEGKRNVCLRNIEVIAKGFKVSLGQLFSHL
jgi:transcriptional regulator with XRE-family HTH domain